MKAADLFTLPQSLSPFAKHFSPDAPPWAWVAQIKAALASLDWSQYPAPVNVPPGVQLEGQVYIHPSVKLPAYATIQGPCWIGAHTEIRPGAFIRGQVIAGEHCVLGNACEFKNSLLMDHVQTPHYNYVGDSVLGNGAHLGAGVICANLRLDQKPVPVQTREGRQESGMRKLGAMLGEKAEAGCNAVLQPGTILEPRAVVMSGVAFSGLLQAATIAAYAAPIRRIRRPD